MILIKQKSDFLGKFHIQESPGKTRCGLVADDFVRGTPEELQLTQRHCAACHNAPSVITKEVESEFHL